MRSLFSAAKRLLAAAQGRVAEGGLADLACGRAASRLASDTFGVALSVAQLDFNSFGIAARMGIAIGQLALRSGIRLRLEGGVFGDAAKVGLECLRPVSEAVASCSAPGPGEVQKLVFVLQLIEKMADLFSGGLGGGYSDQIDLLKELVQARDHSATSISGADEALRQKLTIHVPGRTVAIIDRMCGEALFAMELLSTSSSSSEGNFGLFLLSCTVLSRLPKLPKPVKDANWFLATDGGGGTNLLTLIFELARGCGEQFSRDPYLIPAVDSVDGKQGGNFTLQKDWRNVTKKAQKNGQSEKDKCKNCICRLLIACMENQPEKNHKIFQKISESMLLNCHPPVSR